MPFFATAMPLTADKRASLPVSSTLSVVWPTIPASVVTLPSVSSTRSAPSSTKYTSPDGATTSGAGLVMRLSPNRPSPVPWPPTPPTMRVAPGSCSAMVVVIG